MITIEKTAQVECSSCGGKLDATVVETTRNGCVISVEPCGSCLSDEYQDGRQDGYQECYDNAIESHE